MKGMTQNRRQFMKTMVAAGAGWSMRCGQRTEKPNLLFLWTDQQRANTMAAYGNTAIHTPHLNRLSSESVVFRKAYVSQPVCSPSRSTVMTGLWPHTTGVLENNIPLPEEAQCLPELLNDPDYKTGYFGKWHLGDEVFAQHGFKEWKAIEYYRNYYSENRDKSTLSDYHNYLLKEGFTPDTDDGLFSRGFATRLPLEHTKPKYLERQSIEFLKENQNQPFCLYVNFLEPHNPYYGPLDDEHNIKEIFLPENIDDPLSPQDPLRYRLLRQSVIKNGRAGFDLATHQGWKGLTKQYWGLVSQVDLSVGNILQTLEDLGLADNTIVVFTSDHGDMMGAHNMLGKTVMFEESARVPWLMRIPQFGRKQKMIDQPVSHIDLVPTLLDLMQGDIPSHLPGKSLVPQIKGESTQDEGDVFVEWNPNTRLGSALPRSIPGISEQEIERVHDAPIRTVVTRDGWKLNLCKHDKSQLFNLQEDPYETTNLFYNSQYKNKVDELSRKIADWQVRTHDRVEIV